ncbi:MAG: hypothetical protein EZS28_018284 [Streblomastix strix]|uniref:Uncharacterized protein n=1 Tax=Streblomastix strix TaxID=222440 RepID=A0A5J4VVK6_9EUKA|nr:MAG: hypothetical protein EZS28_018284 [Streblomastix strix]
MKLETNGVMTLKNITLLNNDFLAKITTLEQEVNVIQLTFGTATQDIGENSANGDFAFSAESGTVWIKDTSVDIVGYASSYARSDHQLPIQTVNTIPNSDSADGSYGTVDSYARNDHSQPINVQINASIVSVVNGVGNYGSSAYYSRHDHIHPQQLTYDGNITATKLIKSGGLPTELLCANDDTTAISDNDSDLVKKTGKTLQAVQGVLRHSGDDEESEDDDDYQTRGQIYQFYVNKAQTETIIVESTGSSTIQLGCSRLLNTGQIAGQWTTYTTPSNYTTNRLGFKISLASDSGDNIRGLQISPDGNTLSFNRSVIAGTGATNGASNCSVNYSAGNPILWGVNSTDPIGGFYSNGTNIYRRARTITLGSGPP